MSSEPQDGARSKAERGRMTVLSLMALYLVLAVAVGAARSHLQTSGAYVPAAVAQANTHYR